MGESARSWADHTPAGLASDPFEEERRLRDWLRDEGAELTWFAHTGGHEVGPIASELAAYLRNALAAPTAR